MPSAAQHISNCSIEFGGSPAPPELMNDLLDVTVDESNQVPDVFTIRIHDAAFKWINSSLIKEGTEVTIKMADGGEELKEITTGEVTAIEMDMTAHGTPTVIVRGYDLTHRLARGRQARTFLQMTVSDIVKKVCQEAGLQAETDSTGQVREYTMQNNLTNFEFIQELARDNNFNVWVRKKKLYFKKIGQGDASEIELEWGKTLRSFHIQKNTRNQVDKVIVRSWDAKQKQGIIGTATRPEIPPKVSGQGGGGGGGQSPQQQQAQPAASQQKPSSQSSQQQAMQQAQQTRDAADNAVRNRANEMTNQVQDSARRASDSAQSSANQASGAAQQARQATQQMAQQTNSAIASAQSKAAEAVGNARNQMSSIMNQMGSAAQSAIAQGTQQAAQQAQQAIQQGKQQLAQAASAAQAAASNAAERAKQQTHQAAQQAQQSTAQAQQQAAQAAHSASNMLPKQTTSALPSIFGKDGMPIAPGAPAPSNFAQDAFQAASSQSDSSQAAIQQFENQSQAAVSSAQQQIGQSVAQGQTALSDAAEQAGNVVNQAQTAQQEMQKSATNAVNDIQSSASSAAADMHQQAAEQADQMSNAVQSAAQSAQENAAQAKEQAAKAVSDAQQKAQEQINQTSQQAQAAMQQAQETGAQKVNSAANAVSQQAQNAQKAAQQAAQQVSESVQRSAQQAVGAVSRQAAAAQSSIRSSANRAMSQARQQQEASANDTARQQASAATGGGGGGGGDPFSGAIMTISNRPVYTQDEAQKLAQSVLEELASSYIEAEGLCFGKANMRPNSKIKINNIGQRFSGTYQATSVTHTWSPHEGYTTSFVVSGKRQMSMLQALGADGKPTRSMHSNLGVFVGIVTNNEDPDKMGRIKVKIPALTDDHESHWARIASLMAGSKRGWYILPEVNDEVLVCFEHGDIHRPYIIGMLWNGKDELPEKDVLESGNKVARRIFYSRIGHKIMIDDKDGKGDITVKTANDHILALNDKDKKIEVKTKDGHHIEMDDQNKKLTVKTTGGHTIEMDDNGQKITIKDSGGNKIEMQAMSGTVSVTANMKVEIKAPNVDVKADGMMNLQSTGIMNIKGSLVNINS